jgi:hypothetical protein
MRMSKIVQLKKNVVPCIKYSSIIKYLFTDYLKKIIYKVSKLFDIGFILYTNNIKKYFKTKP